MTARAGPLLDQILRDGVAAAEARLAAAGAEAEHIVTHAREQATRRHDTAVGERERALNGAQESARAEASQRVARETLGARAAVLDRIFAAAATQLGALATHPRLAEVLGATLADALTYLPDGPATVRCPRDAAGAVRDALAAGREAITVCVDESVALGAIVESTGGAVSVDATFATRLVRARPRLAIDIAKKLATAAP